jgi:pyruvate carboxylase subunit B
VRRELGYPPLVAPIRQVIATQAVYNVIAGERYATVTQELKDYLQGLYGRPPVPADHELRRLVLGREEPITIRPADLLEPQVENSRWQVRKLGFEPSDDNLLIHLMFPGLAPEYLSGPPPKAAEKSAPEPVAALLPADPAPVEADDANPPAAAPVSTAEFEVEVEGEVFKVRVTGAGMTVTPASGAAPAAAPPPPRTGEGTVIAPMQGLIVKIPVKTGDEVKLGDVVAVLEAMKMQNDIVTTVAGRVSQVYVKEGEVVSPNQPLLAVG